MSLQKKIILSFLISSVLIAALAIAGSVGFIEIRKEIRYLELSDTLRSKTLQLRRHEKNFLLYQEQKERDSVRDYIGQVRAIIEQNRGLKNGAVLHELNARIGEYEKTFGAILKLADDVHNELDGLDEQAEKKRLYRPEVEATFLENPLVNASLLKNVFGLASDAPVIATLSTLNAEIGSLRKEGEEILVLSKKMDSGARQKADLAISYIQKASVILFPLFLLVGMTALFVVSRSAVNQIEMITGAIEKTGKGQFSSLSVPHEQDEVGRLIDAFNRMESDLIERDREIGRKNEELLQSRKLASIGTLASGVAHELNNPLNNIYLSAQILSKEIGDENSCPAIVKETVGDIYAQTLRVKRIVSDLLEFSREKPPDLRSLDLVSLVRGVVDQMEGSGELQHVRHTVSGAGVVTISGDRYLLEQVFVNLFTNAVQAMNGEGELNIDMQEKDGEAVCRVSDTGPGIPRENISRIFDPFFTTKGRGTGLGLAIVYTIIEKHKGRITVESGPDRGTTFILAIPRGT
ncbi:MAG: ATP-binding protein [Nitrospiraceae bacterium]|nr:ATP-binding protein [Nitrospiraceae bacterium]